METHAYPQYLKLHDWMLNHSPPMVMRIWIFIRGSYHGRKKSKYDGVSYISPQFDKTDQLKCKCGFRKEFHYPYSCYSCGPEAHHGKGKIVGFTTNGRIIWRDLCTGKIYG